MNLAIINVLLSPTPSIHLNGCKWNYIFFVVAMNDRKKSDNKKKGFTQKNQGMCMTKETFTAVIHREGDLYVAVCPEVGTASQGKTVETAVNNLKEATELYLEEFPMPKVERSFMTTFEALHG